MNIVLPNPTFVVAIVEDNKIQSYYGIDSNSGGYPSYSTSLKSAEYYTDQEKAQGIADRLNKSSKKERTAPYHDGVLYPDTEVWWALNLHEDKKPKANGEAVVLCLNAEVVYSQPIWGEIIKPTGFKYE